MIDVGEIYNRCIDAARLAVGSDLHQITQTGTGTVGAVFKSKSKRPSGIYPFIIVDVATRRAQGSWASDRFYDVDGNLVTDNIYDYFITYAVYGGEALEIASELESSFVREDVQNIFSVDNFLGVAETFPITSTTTKIDNQVKDFASFILKVTAVDRVTSIVDDIAIVTADLNMRQRDSEDNIVSATLSITAP